MPADDTEVVAVVGDEPPGDQEYVAPDVVDVPESTAVVVLQVTVGLEAALTFGAVVLLLTLTIAEVLQLPTAAVSV